MFGDLDGKGLKYKNLFGGFGMLVELFDNLEVTFGTLGEELDV